MRCNLGYLIIFFLVTLTLVRGYAFRQSRTKSQGESRVKSQGDSRVKSQGESRVKPQGESRPPEGDRSKAMDRYYVVTSKDCKDEEPFPNFRDCHKFFQCLRTKDGSWILTQGTCDVTSHYDQKKKICVDGYYCKNSK